jgi:hypothetical protein
MATRTVTKSSRKLGASRRGAPSEVDVRRDLVVEILPGEYVRWSGTTVQLVAEGLLPAWFGPDCKNTSWEESGFEFRLQHFRPDHMAPKEWRANARDYWQLSRSLKYGRLWDCERQVSHTPAATQQQQQQHEQALRDNRFQAFLSLVGAKSAMVYGASLRSK